MSASHSGRRGAPPHYPTQAELAEQRREFALDSAEDRPYHHLAHASERRGRPWHSAIASRSMLVEAAWLQDGVLRDQVRALSPEAMRLARLYVSEAPHLRTRTAGDGERWAQALRLAQAARA